MNFEDMVTFFEVVGYFCSKHRSIPIFLSINVAIVVFAYRKSKGVGFFDYAVAGGYLPVGVWVLSLLGTKVGFGELFVVDSVFHFGVAQVVVGVVWVVFFVLMGRVLAPLLVYFSDCMTFGGVMERLYGGGQVLSGIVGCLCCVFVAVLQIRMMGYMGYYLLGLPEVYGMVFWGGFVVLYSVSGGMRGVCYTDILQVIIGFVAIFYVVQALFSHLGMVSALHRVWERKSLMLGPSRLGYKFKWAMLGSGTPVFLFLPPFFHRMLVMKDRKKAKRMWYKSAFLYGFFLFLLMLVGVGAMVAPVDLGLMPSVDHVLLHVTKFLFRSNPFVLDLIFLGLLGLLFATLDSYLHAVGVVLVEDIMVPLQRRLTDTRMGDIRKGVYARIGVFLVGLLAIGGAVWGGHFLEGVIVERIGLAMVTMMVIPLLIGVLGVKGDRFALVAFLVVYFLSMGVLEAWAWGKEMLFYDGFLVGVLLSVMTYLLAHIYKHGGLVLLERDGELVSERLWIPSWAFVKGLIKKVVFFPCRLSAHARKKAIFSEINSVNFGIVMIGVYVVWNILPRGLVGGMSSIMNGFHIFGVLLCGGLILRGAWPDRLKPHFPMYWFFTLFYCLPFGSTLTFFCAFERLGNLSFWVGSFVLLAFLVDSVSFLVMSLVGIGSGVVICMVLTGNIFQEMWHSEGYFILLFLCFGALFFGKRSMAYIHAKRQEDRILSNCLGMNFRHARQLLKEAGLVHKRGSEVGKEIVNAEGEHGYWIHKDKALFLERFSERVALQGEDVKKDVARFLRVVERQILGSFDREEVSMRSVVEEAMYRIQDQLMHKVRVRLSCTKDFRVKLPTAIFGNILFSLLWNASVQGDATEIVITIDGEGRSLLIHDNGMGISAKKLPYIFDLRYVPSKHGKKNPKIGLAFIKMVVRASGGKISCHSRHGDQGSFTTFKLVFGN